MSETSQVVFVTGPSGAGRSTAINVLEDLGFEAIDNLPMGLLMRLLDGPALRRPLALGLDARNRDFSTEGFLDLSKRLSGLDGFQVTTLYLDCSADVLLRRFSETRRRHPMSPGSSPLAGVERELELLRPIREAADTLIDTTALNVHQLRREVERWFAPSDGSMLAISVESFSFKRGLPRGLDMVFDCRFLANPYWQPTLRASNGRDPAVASFVHADPQYLPFFERVTELLRSLLPAFRHEGKTHLSVGFGCTGGQHRSVALAEAVAKALADAGEQVSIRHREMERRKPDVRPD
ncbi:RNase adapter RapZ [Ruegeria pomeroyi]|uniref:RNase adapter RapZ n=1 Tax=Ruegeria pomeroyi TaxID=89184 RepID=UPI001F3E6D1E|nr:RNase adapter RapZ [Ruegeria pomeroyi]MCE8510739.1 RNase adapter RapZ [Ruegeria pomeroyi]MCE8553474.1 RNase adapter RapZ [Ruegeria pomeroyi]